MRAADRQALDAALIEAHGAGDPGRLARLYRQAAEALDRSGDGDAACFLHTQAYVFALEAGLDEARAFATTLRARGRL